MPSREPDDALTPRASPLPDGRWLAEAVRGAGTPDERVVYGLACASEREALAVARVYCRTRGVLRQVGPGQWELVPRADV